MILLHGTTRQRAESILRNGPDPRYRESQAESTEGGFYMCTESGPFDLGTPRDYAVMKSRLFPSEGGPAIVKVDVPLEIVRLAEDGLFQIKHGVINFDEGHGIEELLECWPQLTSEMVVTA